MIRALCLLAVLLCAACDRQTPADARFVAHPAAPDATVEYFVERPSGPGPWPVLVFLHGHQNGPARPGGRVFKDWGVLDRYARQGYLSVSVSLPGYGASNGPADFAGPHARAAVSAVLARLEAEGLADPDRVLLHGVSLGAVVAGLMAAEDPGVDGLVLVSGLYDLPAFFERKRTPGALAVGAAALRQTGGDPAALEARSLLPRAGAVRASVLILNGAKDDRTDPDQARRLAEAVNAAGGNARVVVYEEFGHDIPVAARQAEIDRFLASRFPAGPISRP